MEIRIKSIKLQNFKAIHSKDVVLDGKDAVISGANGSGKTSIYEAYYWCLFGKTLASNGIVQTLDKDNNIVHKVDTVVEVVLDINGEYDVKIRRALVEKWKAKNTPDEKFTGTEVQRFWNDVPVSMAEYKRKLEGIVPIAQWQLLSNNSAFMGYKMEDRRKMLLSVAGEVDEASLLEKYPAIQNAIKEHKTIDELNKQTKNTRKNANKELTEIPAKISAQDALKVDTANEEGTNAADNVEKYFKELAEAQNKVDDIKKDFEDSKAKGQQVIRQQIFKCETTLHNAQSEQQRNAEEQKKRIKTLTEATTNFEKAKQEWNAINNENFDFQQSEKCPVCGQPLPEAFKRNEYANAVKEFNEQKSTRLKEKMDEAQQYSQQKTVLTGAKNAYLTITKPKDDKAVEAAETALKEAQNDLEHDSKFTIEDDKAYIEAQKALEEVKARRPANTDDIVKLKADQEINARVEKEKKRLQERSAELTKIIADCDNTLYQIFNYKKEKIEAVEDKVNSFFSLVSWKFFQQNVTNDDLQEICTCIVNGVDYNNLNTASKVNASVDIVNGISKAAQISVPCFVDGRESITELIPSVGQQISLKVVDNAPLEVTTK